MPRWSTERPSDVFVSNHVVAGAGAGYVARGRPGPAFALGLASHFAMDALPHWGDVPAPTFLRAARRDGVIGLALSAALIACAPPAQRWGIVAGITGAALPDLDKPVLLVAQRSPWPRWFDWFHARIQRNRQRPSRLRLEAALASTGSVFIALLLLRRRPSADVTRP